MSKSKDKRIAAQKRDPYVKPPGRPKYQKPNELQVLRLTDRFERAIEYAIHVHAGQRRKQTSVPYLAHLLGVASIVFKDRGDEDEVIAALLHDAPEDQGGQERLDDITSRFGDTIVEGCTDTFERIKPKWLPRKQKYITQLREKRSQSVLRVSGADKLHNLRAIAADFYTGGAHVFCRFKGQQIRG
jgi:(p)ppGpp synthase/HD superfamily hydrolase